MSKFTKKAIMYAFLEILEEKTLDKITVKDICERSEINRNTFYYYFDNVHDVLFSVFEMERKQVFKGLKEGDTFLDAYRKSASMVLNNKQVIVNIYYSRDGGLLRKYIEDVTMDFTRNAVEKAAEGYNISEENMKFMAHFYTNAICGTTMKWIENGMPPYKDDFLDKVAKSYEVTVGDLLNMFNNK